MLLLSDSVLNATPDLLATDMVLLARTRYAGVNHTHLSELLRDREGIDIIPIRCDVAIYGLKEAPGLPIATRSACNRRGLDSGSRPE